jgi:hypothetical protein
MDRAALLSSLSYSWDALSLKGGLQLGEDTWGVFEDDSFEVMIRNPLRFPARVSLSIDGERVPEFELASIERRAVGGAMTFATAQRHPEESSSSAAPRFDIVALFESGESPLGPEPQAAGISVIRLGEGSLGQLSESQIANVADLAAREVLSAYLSGFGPDEVGKGITWKLAAGKSVEEAAALEGIDEEDTIAIDEEFRIHRRSYLDAMVAEARQRVVEILTFANSPG